MVVLHVSLAVHPAKPGAPADSKVLDRPVEAVHPDGERGQDLQAWPALAIAVDVLTQAGVPRELGGA